MKKRNKNSCPITNLWPSVEDMKKDLFIDLDKQEIFKVSNRRKIKFSLRGSKRPIEKQHYRIHFRRNRKNYSLSVHRLFFYWHYGYLPKLIDHKDTNSQNNKIENLRVLDISGNAMNSTKRKTYKGKATTSIYKGVSFHSQTKKWQVHLMCKGKKIALGLFDNEDDAGQAYNDAVRKYGLEDVSVLNDTPQERARTLSLFDNPEPITNLK